MDVLRELETGPAAGILVRCLVDYMWMAPVFSLLYLLAVFGGRRWMQKQEALCTEEAAGGMEHCTGSVQYSGLH